MLDNVTTAHSASTRQWSADVDRLTRVATNLEQQKADVLCDAAAEASSLRAALTQLQKVSAIVDNTQCSPSDSKMLSLLEKLKNTLSGNSTAQVKESAQDDAMAYR